MHRAVVAALLVLGVLAPSAHADPQTEAKQHFTAAATAHKEGRFRDAVRELMMAYALDPRPELLFAIAQVHVKLGECSQAITFYERFLASNPKPEHATQAREAITMCKTNPPPPEPMQADPAKPREELGPTREEHLRKAAEAEALAATERRKAEEARIAAERERELEQRYDRHPARKWALIGGAIGAGTLATGGVFAVLSRNAHASFVDAGCGDRMAVLSADQVAACRADAERGERNARLGNIFMAAGGGVLAGAVLLFVIDPGNVERPASATRVSVTPTSIMLTGTW